MKGDGPVAIVTDALWRKSVSAIRSLGEAGFEIFALGDSRLTTGFYSRYTSRSFVGPTAAGSPDGFGETLQRAVAAAGGRPVVVLPMEDASCEWFLGHAPMLPDSVHWLLPGADAFAVARDKARTMEAAQELGIPCPRTFSPASPSELRSLIDGARVE